MLCHHQVSPPLCSSRLSCYRSQQCVRTVADPQIGRAIAKCSGIRWTCSRSQSRSQLNAEASPKSSKEPGDSNKLVGEDAASFDLGEQSVLSWSIFSALLAGALGALYLVRGVPEDL